MSRDIQTVKQHGRVLELLAVWSTTGDVGKLREAQDALAVLVAHASADDMEKRGVRPVYVRD